MTMQIMICDDCQADAVQAQNVITQAVKNLHVKAEFDYYSKAADVEKRLLQKHEPADILILDIDMPEVSGLELAERLRQEMQELLIIFLSSHEEFVFKAIEFQPFRYIRKLCLEAEMPVAICSAAKILMNRQDKQIIFKTNDGEVKEMHSNVVYVEAAGRKISVHLQNGSHFIANHKISELMELTQSENFIMIHRSCIVNANYIRNISNGILILDNHEKLVISRTRYKEVRQQLLKVWGDLL